MFRITTFQELIKGLPRGTFDKFVQKNNSDKYCKQFRHWDHLIAMTYAQLSGVSGLRPLEMSFNSYAGHHYHLNTKPIKRSTLADANSTRKDDVFADVVEFLMHKVSRQLRQQTKELMYLLDSTSITLKGKEFDRWTQENRTRYTQGIKLHVLYEAQTQAPVWKCFSAANVNDVEKARNVPLEKGAVYVFDKGYCDYNWWHQIEVSGAFFVTRFKRNAGLKFVSERPIPNDVCDRVLQDQIVCFKNKHPGGKRINHYEKPLRCITVARPDKPTPLVLATNDLTSDAIDIAQRYKERWGIELFFKWIKQHLKVKKFFGRSENAVRIQLLTALISYLLVAIYKQTHNVKQSLWECLCMIRATLFQRVETDDSLYRRRKKEHAEMARLQLRLI